MDNTVPALEGDPVFRFDADLHEYTDEDGREIPHISKLLALGGLVDDTWYTAAGSVRGSAVHTLTADYDMGALDVAGCVSPYRGYLLAHVAAVRAVKPEWLAIEEPIVHPVYRFGGRPDREAMVYGVRSVWDEKTGGPAKVIRGVTAHGVQLALQAILCARRARLPPERMGRYVLYLKKTGRFSLQEQTNPRDFAEARELIAKYCGSGAR